MKTPFTSTKAAIADRKWFVVDLEDVSLGRAASKIAHVLRGKHKASFTPHLDDGDFIIAINVGKIKLTGNKADDKKYYRHTGHPGGLKFKTAGQILTQDSDRLLRLAVKGMLPSGPLGRAQLKKLKSFDGGAHPHAAQQPIALDLSTVLATST
ncbi:MAG: 50S ribosomal protein L13 [Myxococcales bacterium]|nr:50S ribosomal protein L13 [Myxococcales bacterium]